MIIHEIKKLLPSAHFSAIAGSAVRETGATIIRDITSTAGIMGFSAVLKKLPMLIRQFREARTYIRQEKPGLCIFVDYPDFNLRLARVAKEAGLKTLYYIPPKLWAWRKGRVQSFKKYIDATAVIFPFEKQFFLDYGYSKARFVGHPFTATLTSSSTAENRSAAKKYICELLQVEVTKKIIAIFPGSRRSEVAAHKELVAGLIKQIKTHNPEYAVVIAATDAVTQETAAEFSASGATVLRNVDSITVLQAADYAALKSGTSNLQAAFTDTPCCMFFITSPLNYRIITTFVALKSYSPLNIVVPGTTKEFIQTAATPEALYQNLQEFLQNEAVKIKQLANYEKIREVLGAEEVDCIPVRTVAQMAIDLVRPV